MSRRTVSLLTFRWNAAYGLVISSGMIMTQSYKATIPCGSIPQHQCPYTICRSSGHPVVEVHWMTAHMTVAVLDSTWLPSEGPLVMRTHRRDPHCISGGIEAIMRVELYVSTLVGRGFYDMEKPPTQWPGSFSRVQVESATDPHILGLPSEELAVQHTLTHLSGLEPLNADHEANNCHVTKFRMQQNTVKACIRPTAPYLRPLLKLDNLPLICKYVSANVLHRIFSVGTRL